MKAVQDILINLYGGNNMPKTIEVMNAKDAADTDIMVIFEKIASADGLHVRGSGYKALKKRFRENMKNHAVDVDSETGYYNVSEWRPNDGSDVAIRVDYRVPLYTNSNGFEVKGKRLSIAQA